MSCFLNCVCVCVLVFQIGEFVYLIEGTGDIPLPSRLLPMDSPNILHVSSTLEGKVNKREKSKIEQIILCCKYSLVFMHFY